VTETPLEWITAVAVLILIAGYGIGAPFLLLRTALAVARHRRLRYRTSHDDVLASSRFTIPVSLILAVKEATTDLPAAIQRLLELRYPELELIVVIDNQSDALETLKLACELSPCELFFRRTLNTAQVRGIYRSAREPRLLVADKVAGGIGDALNCGVNLARYRYVCAVDGEAAYSTDSLLDAMQAALEDPALVVGVTTSLAVTPVESATAALSGKAPTGLIDAVRYLTAARTRLLTVGRRRLDLPPGGCPGFTIWRRDAVVEAGGFAPDADGVHAELTFRMHWHYRADRRRYRIIHVSEPVGAVDPVSARERILRSGYVPLRLLWRHRRMLFNPSLGRLGLWDLPRYGFSLVVAPWLEIAALVLLALAVPLGVVSAGELLLVIFIIAFGSGVVANAALLVSAGPGRDSRPAALFNLIVAGPLEYFLTRPTMLLSQLRTSQPENRE
jgi:cellulose synthase/poly-beta-1,6-N-acetylglucosamine synthase-like glycosyltransferase